MEQKKNADDYFSRTAETSGDRGVDIPDDEEEHHRSLAQVEEETPGQSDLQVTLKRLFPIFTDSDVNMLASAVMVGRGSPDTHIASINLTWMSILKSHLARGERVNAVMLFNLVKAAYEIGLDGKGRIDAIELHGAAKESEELERMSKSLGGLD